MPAGPSHSALAAHLAATPERAQAFAGPLAVIAGAAKSKGPVDVEALRAASRAARAKADAQA
jgi:hypothetical protein